MTKTLFALSLGFVGLILATRAGFAGPPCGAHNVIVGHLGAKYQETRKGIGMAANNDVLEIFASEAGTWTITVTMPSGMTCLLASGKGWETMAEVLPPKGDPA